MQRNMKTIHMSGKRKTARARATLKEGNGTVRINSQSLDILPDTIYKTKMQEPLIIAGDTAKKVSISVQVEGGGMNTQAEATRLAIARALAQYDKKLHKEFLEYDRTLLVADVRTREERKPNTHGKARSKRQKSYR